MVKDLLADNIDGQVIYFCEETARIAKPGAKDKHRPVIGMHVISVKIGDHCYHGYVIWVISSWLTSREPREVCPALISPLLVSLPD